jgi:hypothetical protein
MNKRYRYIWERLRIGKRQIVIIEMKGITRCKLTIISESAVHKKFLGQIISYPARL